MIQNKLLPCKLCGSEGVCSTWEIEEDDEGKYTFEMYYCRCSNYNCPNKIDELQFTEEDASEEWNKLNYVIDTIEK